MMQYIKIKTPFHKEICLLSDYLLSSGGLGGVLATSYASDTCN